MKDGRPSRIRDIRYFHGHIHRYLEGHHDAVAFGRRLAWLLNGEEFSLGAYHSLYILLTPALEPGGIQITEYGADWWQRYAHVGVAPGFPDTGDASEVVMAATVAALKAIRPDPAKIIEHAANTVRACGDDLRFLIKTHQTKRYTVDIAFQIAVWPQPSLLFVSLMDRVSGTFLEAPPTPIQLYADAFDLAGAIRITEDSVVLSPKRSFVAMLSAARYGGPLVKAISEFSPRARPVLSKMVSNRD